MQPHSLGGKTTIDNVFIADKFENSKRGIKPISEVITYKDLFDYYSQFIDVKIKGFNGNEYIIKTMRTIFKLGGLAK